MKPIAIASIIVLIAIVSLSVIVISLPKEHLLAGPPPSLSQSAIQTTNSTYDVHQYSVIPTICHALDNGILPDPNCTPGAFDQVVTQSNIDTTICVPGYTKMIRPSVSYTEPLKFKLMGSYGYNDSARNYELDHLIPLEIGGSPTDVRNLWPEPHYTTPNSYDKDRFENYLHDQVCSGAIDLKTAQDEIATNWLRHWEDAGTP